MSEQCYGRFFAMCGVVAGKVSHFKEAVVDEEMKAIVKASLGQWRSVCVSGWQSGRGTRNGGSLSRVKIMLHALGRGRIVMHSF